MASTPLIAGRSSRYAQSGAVSHPHLFHGHFPNASGGSTVAGDSDAGVFFWRGSRLEEAQGTTLVAWETVCRLVSHDGLGIQSLQHTNLALLTKWVCRLLSPLGDLVSVLLVDYYKASLNWHKWQIPERGDSAFMSSFRPIFSAVQAHFQPKLGSRASF